MSGRIRVSIVDMSEAEKTETLRQMAEAMASIGFSQVKPRQPPKPQLRVIMGGGGKQ